jgi:hypothetical protein
MKEASVPIISDQNIFFANSLVWKPILDLFFSVARVFAMASLKVYIRRR